MRNKQEEVMVSIICNTYNHKKYIRDALEGFVCQKTSFLFEVLIHDDASVDGTQEVIKEYENKYPSIIKPIYQIHNQYSKGVSITRTYQYPRVNGKYIAICEGDDYWTDTEKLQKQVDILEKHRSLDICTHCVKRVDCITGKESLIAPSTKSGIIPVSEIILGGGGYVGTNSIMYRTSLIYNLPTFVAFYPLDFTIQVYGSLRGGMYYLADEMSIYRYLTPGSWSQKQRNDDKRARSHYKKWLKMLRILNSETHYKYNDEIQTVVLIDGVSLLNTKKENRDIIRHHKQSFNKINLKVKTKLLLITYTPWVVKIIKKFRTHKKYEY